MTLVVHTTASADIDEKIYELTGVGATQQESKAKAVQKAIEMVTTEMLEDVMAGSKGDANKKNIISRMVKDSPRYVVSVQDRIISNGKVEVKLGVSIDSFKQILVQKVFLHEITGPIRVLPMVTISDRVNGGSASWWNDFSKFTPSTGMPLDAFHKNLKEAFLKGGFFAYDPLAQRLNKKIPRHLRSERPSTSDLVVLSQYFKASLIVTGQISFFKSNRSADSFRVEVELKAIEAIQDRVVAEVVRSYETEPGLFQTEVQKVVKDNFPKIAADLATQVIESWKKGSLGSQQMRLSLNGRLTHTQYESLKDAILKQVAEIKTIRERLFEPNKIVLEVDTASKASVIADRLSRQKIPNLQLSIEGVRENSVDLNLKSK